MCCNIISGEEFAGEKAIDALVYLPSGFAPLAQEL